MAGITFYHLDLETTGLKSEWHEITELSILRSSDRVQLSRQVKADYPDRASYDSLRITNKTMSDLAKGISKKQLVQDVERFVCQDELNSSYRCLVGHNVISFDKKFLWHLWDSDNKVFPFDLWLDTMHMMRAYAKKKQLVKPKLNLTASCDLLGVKRVGVEHTAKSDTQNCYLLWEKLMLEIDYLDYIRRIPHRDDATE